VAFFDPLKGLYLPCCGKVVCWGSHPLEPFHNTDFKGRINCPLCGMLNLASQPAFFLLQEVYHTNPPPPSLSRKQKWPPLPEPLVWARSVKAPQKRKKLRLLALQPSHLPTPILSPLWYTTHTTCTHPTQILLASSDFSPVTNPHNTPDQLLTSLILTSAIFIPIRRSLSTIWDSTLHPPP